MCLLLFVFFFNQMNYTQKRLGRMGESLRTYAY